MKIKSSLTLIYDEFDCSHSLFQIDSPEKRLLCAVLKRAIEDYMCPERSMLCKDRVSLRKKTFRDAEFWLRDSAKGERSCLWILEYITKDASLAHKAILRMLDDPTSKEYIKENALNHRVYSTNRKPIPS